jgi:hypothetical protein
MSYKKVGFTLSHVDNDDTIRGTRANGGTKKESAKEISLRVAEAEQRDVGRKIARVEPEIIERLNITSGDALELTSLGKKATVQLVNDIWKTRVWRRNVQKGDI